MAYCAIEIKMPLKEDLSYIEHQVRRRLEAEDSELPENDHIFIKTDDSNTTTWSTMGGKFTIAKTVICF
jgi:hypothetical protein